MNCKVVIVVEKNKIVLLSPINALGEVLGLKIQKELEKLGLTGERENIFCG